MILSVNPTVDGDAEQHSAEQASLQQLTEKSVSEQSPLFLGLKGGCESRARWVSGTTVICYHGNKGLF